MEPINEMERTMTTKGSLFPCDRGVIVSQHVDAKRVSSTHTLKPGESSVYNRSIVLDEPPAPADRVELGFALTSEPAARRLE